MRTGYKSIAPKFDVKPNYLDESTGKNALHLVVDSVCNEIPTKSGLERCLSAVQTICKSNHRALYQLEYETTCTPLAYLLANNAINLNVKKAVMFKLLGCGASFEYAMRNSAVEEGFLEIARIEKDGALQNIMLTALYIGRGAQCVGMWSSSLPSLIHRIISNTRYSDILKPDDFEPCLRDIERKKLEENEAKIQAEMEAAKLSNRMYAFFGGSTSQTSTGWFASKKKPEEEESARLEERVEEARKIISADTFLDRELRALYALYAVLYKPISKKDASFDPIKWLTRVTTGQDKLNMFQVIVKLDVLDVDAVYFVDKLLQAGLRYKFLER